MIGIAIAPLALVLFCDPSFSFARFSSIFSEGIIAGSSVMFQKIPDTPITLQIFYNELEDTTGRLVGT